MTERLRIENLTKIFGEKPERAQRILAAGGNKKRVFDELGVVVGLNNVSLKVLEGSTYVVMGLSGSGKSTLARCVNRLNEPTSGRILLDGLDIMELDERDLRQLRRTRLSMVFQHFALLPNKRVIENVEFGLKLRGVLPKQRRARAHEVLAVVGLAQWHLHYPHELSGGMRQRVGLARALATDADVLIMDEAFSALDPLIRSEMQEELLRLQQTLRKTIIFITHDFQEALKIGTRIAIMSEGEVVREGTPQSIVLDPGSDYIAAFTREVDRARLFDARSAMGQVCTLLEVPQGTVVGAMNEADGPAFVVDGERRVIGSLTGAELRAARTSGTIGTPDGKFICVSDSARLVHVARSYREGRPIGVVDADGRLIGILDAEQILSRIATTAHSSVNSGAHDAAGR